MAHNERHEELVAALALGLPLGNERAELERHLAEGCPQCEALLADFRGAARMRLEHHLRQFIVYVLRRGHGRLRKRGRRKTAQVVFDIPAWQTAPKEGYDYSADMAKLRRDYDAAQRLVELTRALPAPYRPSFDQRQPR